MSRQRYIPKTANKLMHNSHDTETSRQSHRNYLEYLYFLVELNNKLFPGEDSLITEPLNLAEANVETVDSYFSRLYDFFTSVFTGSNQVTGENINIYYDIIKSSFRNNTDNYITPAQEILIRFHAPMLYGMNILCLNETLNEVRCYLKDDKKLKSYMSEVDMGGEGYSNSLNLGKKPIENTKGRSSFGVKIIDLPKVIASGDESCDFTGVENFTTLIKVWKDILECAPSDKLTFYTEKLLRVAKVNNIQDLSPDNKNVLYLAKIALKRVDLAYFSKYFCVGDEQDARESFVLKNKLGSDFFIAKREGSQFVSNYAEEEGSEFLNEALASASDDIVKFLLDNGADISLMRRSTGETLLNALCKQKRSEVFQYYLHNHEVSYHNLFEIKNLQRYRQSVFEDALISGEVESVKAILSFLGMRSDIEKVLFSINVGMLGVSSHFASAILSNEPSMVKFLYDVNHDIFTIPVNRSGDTAFQFACKNGKIRSAKSLYDLCPSEQRGDLVNFRSSPSGQHPITLAYHSGDVGIVNWLLSLKELSFDYVEDVVKQETNPVNKSVALNQEKILVIIKEKFQDPVIARPAALRSASSHTASSDSLVEPQSKNDDIESGRRDKNLYVGDFSSRVAISKDYTPIR